MGKIVIELESAYDAGDIVIFKRNNKLLVGIVEGYYADQASSNNSIWYNIRTGNNNVYTYSNGGDIAEFDIICKLDDKLAEEVSSVISNIVG